MTDNFARTADREQVPDPAAPALLDEAIAGLSKNQKSLSPKWLYDPLGSALFEEITDLPEYYLTRTETDILRRNADRLVGWIPNRGALIELGSGASIKTRLLLDAAKHLDAYVPIDISSEFLRDTAQNLRSRYPLLNVIPVVGDFSRPLTLPGQTADHPKVGFFSGSTIGNLDPKAACALLRSARAWRNVQGFILGVDLVKDPDELIAAYDDAQGVTARFIANVLTRLNREAGASFNPDAFSYEARWNSGLARIDMVMVSKAGQAVDLPGARIEFAAGETIHISASRKYTSDTLAALVDAAGWKVDHILTDADSRFAVAYLTPSDA